MPLLIRNGEIVNAGGRQHADIYVEDELITRIGKGLDAPPGCDVIDATGQYVFPGFIDPHVHIYLPFMSTFARDTHRTASVAALVGGTTTYMEMCCPSRADDTLAGYQLWKEKAEGNSACDYAFHMAVSKFTPDSEAELRQIVRDGTASLKVFLAYKDFFGVNDEELYRTLKLARDLGVIVTAHCENAELVAQRQRELVAAGKTGPEWHEPSRPEFVEAEGTQHFAAFLECTGAYGYVVHLSCQGALDAALAARKRGVKLAIESVVPHLLLDKTFAERPGLEGAKHVMSPPLREKRHPEALWHALAAGFIDTVGTDHCPFDIEQKSLGATDFTRIPNGIPGIEERVRLLYTYGVQTNRITLERFVEATSTNAAKLFGLYPRKGTIAIGSDADLAVYHPDLAGVLSAKTQHSANNYNGYEGMPVSGRPTVVTVRGRVQVRDGAFVGDASRGRFLKREPSYL